VDVFVDLCIYVANGLLVVLYFLLDHAPELVSVMAATFITLTFDRLAQRQAVFAPNRYGPGATPVSPPRTAQATTGVALGLWLAASWSFGPPVPFIGALMWLMAALALLMMPQQRWSLLWTTKAGMVLYSLTVLGYRLYLWQASQLSPGELADVFGGTASAARLIAQNTGTFATIGSWLLWVVMPAGYCAVLIQNWVAQPMSLISPFAGAQDVLTALRARGNAQLEEGTRWTQE
jgi:hypothetical protein